MKSCRFDAVPFERKKKADCGSVSAVEGFEIEPERVAEAIVDAWLSGKAERYVPRPYWVAAAARILAPAIVRRATGGGAFTTATKAGT